jgi:hypothetical protein
MNPTLTHSSSNLRPVIVLLGGPGSGFYQSSGILIKVHAEGSPTQVSTRVMSAIDGAK